MNKIKSFTKRTLALVLAVLTLASCGLLSAVAANVELAETGVTMTGGETLYLKPNSNWLTNNARFAMYVFTGTSSNAWASMTDSDGDGIYEGTVPSGSWANVIFCRMDPSNSTNSWVAKWNQTSDLTYDGTNNLYTVADNTWDKGGGTWSVKLSSPAYFYFDNSQTQWSEDKNFYLVIGKSSNSTVYQMTKISNTSLYYCSVSSYPSGYNYYAVLANSDWNSGNFGYSSVTKASYYTESCTFSGLTAGSYNVITPSDTANKGTNVSTSVETSYTVLNNSANYVHVRSNSADSTTYANDANAGTVSVSGYTFNGKNSTTTVSATSTLGTDYYKEKTGMARTSTVTIKATAADGYEFIGWYESNGTLISAESEYTYQATSTTVHCYAYFDVLVKSYDINLTAVTGGNVTTTADNVEEGVSVTLTATPNEGYNFTGWTVEGTYSDTDVDLTAPEITLTPTSNLTVKANFQIKTYTVTFLDYNDTKLKEVTVDHGSPALYGDENPTREGYTFEGWEVVNPEDGDATNVTSDMTLKATYTINSYEVKFEDYDGTQIGDKQTVKYNQMPTPPADPSREGYTFTGWNPIVDVATEDVTYTATYTANLYDVTTTYDNTQGTVTVTGLKDDKAEYDSEITVTATAKDGYRLKSLTIINGGNTETDTTFTVKGEVKVTAVFEEIIYKTLTVNETGGTGTLTTDNGTFKNKTLTLEEGSSAIVTVKAPTGYYISSFDGEANTDEKIVEKTYTFSFSEDKTLEVVYNKKSTYTVNVVNMNETAGWYTTEGSLTDLEEGSTVKVTATANSGWSFKSFTVNGVEKTDNPLTLTVTDNTTVQINWEEVTWKGYIYVEDKTNKSSMYCYAWSGSGSEVTSAFPGDKMTKVGTSASDNPVYAIYLNFKADTVKNSSAKFILSGGSISSKYTGDVIITADKNYYILESSGLTADSFVSADPNLPINIYLDNGANKNKKVGETSTTETIGKTTVDATKDGVESISELKKQTADTGNYDTGYYKASVKKNTPITVTCTVQDSDYMVEGFVINATEYVKASNMGGGKYQITYSFTKEGTVVVPIYYYTDAYIAENNIDMITVYAIGDSSISGWGDYMAAYTWYERSDNTTYYGQGSWPGQIMVPVTGAENLYEIKVPATAPDGTPVSGITFSNYGGWPNVAGYMYPVTNIKNLQVYDYYEFVTLAQQGSDNITFVLKWAKDVNNPQAKDSDAPDSSYYVDYVNFSGKPIDILNIKLSDEAAKEAPSLYIIHKAPVEDHTKPLDGKYYVDCYVYTAAGKYLGTFKSYKFLELDYDNTKITSTDGNEVDFKNYYGKRVMIDYQGATVAGNATRYDGQWYGEALTVDLAVNVGLMDDSGSYTVTTNSPANSDVYGFANVAGGEVATVSRGKEVTLSATANSGYKFVGWYYSGTDTCFATTTTTTISAVVDGTYTAVFKELANGEFIVTHEIYNGGGTSSYIPDAHGGRANLYIDIVNNTTGETAPFSLTGQASVSATAGDELVITIATDPLGADRFFAWYIDAKDKYGLTTYEEVGVDNYDGGNYGNIYDNGIDTVIGSNDRVYYQFKYTVKENIFNIALYSDIVPVSVDTTLVYNYNNRYGEVKTYSVKYTLTDDEINGCEGNGYKPYTPTQDTIIDNAPYVEDLYKDTSWILTDSLYDNTLFELWATQPNTVYTVNVNIGGNSKTYSGEFNTEIQIKGKDLDSKATNSGFWFEDVNLDGEYTEGVDRILSYGTYYGLRITKSMSICYKQEESLDFAITIDEPVYGREQTTDSSAANKDFIYIDYLTTLLVPYFKGDTVNGEKITDVTYNGEKVTTTNTSVTIETLQNLGYEFDYGIILEQLSPTLVNTDWGKVETSDDVLEKIVVNGKGYSNDNKTKYCVKYSAVGAYDLTNKNRLLYTFTMPNTENNQNKYYNVYGYLVVTDPNGNTSYYFSNMQTLNILDIGTSAGSTQTGNN